MRTPAGAQPTRSCNRDGTGYARGAVNAGLVWVVSAYGGAALVCVIVIVLMARWLGPMQKARQQAIATLCAQRGFQPGAAPGAFPLLGNIARSWLSNSFSSPDHRVAAADFMRPAGKSAKFFSVLSFTVTGVNVPYVSVTRRGLGAFLIGGPPTVELESIDFDDRFTVKAKDRRCAVMLLDPGMMQLLLDCQQVNFDVLGDNVLAYVNRESESRHKPGDPIEFEQLFRFLDGFVARMPELLRTEYASAT